MEPFLGTWQSQIEKTTGVKDIAGPFGWSDETTAKFAALSYTILFESKGDGYRCHVDYGALQLEFVFKLGETFDYQGADGTKAKCVVNIEGGKFVEDYTRPDGLQWRTARDVTGTTMNTETTVSGHAGAKCTQVLVKA